MILFPGYVVNLGCCGILLVSFMLFPASGSAAHCVVLLHGLAQVTSTMSKLETRLEKSGYEVAYIRYSWRTNSPEVLAENVVGTGIRKCRAGGSERIDFVTHSFGGILVRLYLENHTLEELGRVVMLAPPNQGSRLVDYLDYLPGFGLLGPSVQSLSTGEDGIIRDLKPVSYELGVIAGSKNINPLSWLLLDGPNDSMVTIESTRVDGMDEHLVLPVIHNIMMRNDAVIDHTIHYLKTGSFMPE